MNRNTRRFVVAGIVLLSACTQPTAQAPEATGDSTSAAEHKSSFKPANLNEQIIYQRAMEALSWGMPAVNYDLMYQAFVKTGGSYNQIVFWSKLFDWKNQTLTPNPDVIYVMPFTNTKDVGPMVLEIPPADEGSINGSIMDCWQAAIDDVGPAGADKGKGGKYLILPPDMRMKVTADYIPMSYDTYQGYSLLRSLPKSGTPADIAKAVAYAKRIKLYPFSQAAHPPETKYIDASDAEFNSLIPYDVRFFESLHRMIQSDVWMTRDKAMIDVLKSIGIEKGKPFSPDARTKEILTQAAVDARTWIQNEYDATFENPFYPGTHWGSPAKPELVEGFGNGFSDPDKYPIDNRAVVYSVAFFSAKHLGQGQFYLLSIKDKDGKEFDGAGNYRLTVPANVPVHEFWSVTIYDRETHGLIKDQNRASRSSKSDGIQKNADGTVDIYFGPRTPAGKESNWIPTASNGKFELLFRVYGPDKSFFEKHWALTDATRLNNN